MRRLSIIRRLLFAVAVIVVSAVVAVPCSARKKKTVKAQTVSAMRLSYNDSRRFSYFFLEAARQQNAGNLTAAYDLLRHCLAIDPSSAQVHYMLSAYYSVMRQDSLALVGLKAAAHENPANTVYQERLAQYYLGQSRYDDATRVYEHLMKISPNRVDVLSLLINLYQQRKDYSKMLSALDRMEQMEGPTEKITLAKMQVYELLGDKKKAFATLKALSDNYPNDVNYRVMMGNWLMQNGQQDEAWQIFSKAIEEEPQNVFVQGSLYDYYNTTGQDSAASALMRSLLVSPRTSEDFKLQLVKNAIQSNERHGGDSLVILKLFDDVMKANPKDGQMAEMKVAYMTLKQMPQSMIDSAMTVVLGIAPDNNNVRLQLIESMWNRKDWKGIVAQSEAGSQYNPDEMGYYYFKGLAYYQMEDEDKALDAFRRGVAEIKGDSRADLVADFYALMGDILHKKGKVAEAFAAYDSCLRWRPEHIGCLNNYAYYLSERDSALQKAEQMSYKTIVEEPANPTYLDTYAWILFLQGRYSEASVYIDKALANDTDSTQSAVVLEHAGDIHFMNNDKASAIDLWNRALKAGNSNPLLPKKIKLKKYIKR